MMLFSTPRSHRFFALPLSAVVVALGAGCEFNSFLDPSVVGRHETTAAEAPILERLDVIEADEEEFLATTAVTADDLIPEIVPYIIGPGDRLTVSIEGLFVPDVPFEIQRIVDQTGFITLPVIGSVQAASLTEAGAQERILEALYDQQIFNPDAAQQPDVIVIADAKQRNSYSVLGQVFEPGRYPIPQPRFLLLDAMAAAGGIPESAETIYIIRQVPLDDSVISGIAPGRPLNAPQPETPAETDVQEPQAPEEEPPRQPGDSPLDDLIDDLLESEDEPAGDPSARAEPVRIESVMASAESRDLLKAALQPEDEPSDGLEEMIEQGPPAVDLPEPGGLTDPLRDRWVYLNGEWVKVRLEEIPADPTEAAGSEEEAIARLVTQRIIEVPVKPLIEGQARYNIVIRPNDIIRIPSPPRGFFYMEGQVARPGAFDLPTTGRMTLRRAIATSGGLGPLAIPERVDVTRIVGPGRQATVRLNYKAIVDMTEPDIYIKPDDTITVGTTWYAAPLAIIRNGFRATYGFGFLLDRNFGNDVFGAPPTDRFGN